MIATIAHALNTPVDNIEGWATDKFLRYFDHAVTIIEAEKRSASA